MNKPLPNKILCYCEDHGIYEIYKVRGNVITYYSFFTGEGIYKIVKNIKTGKETRKLTRYKSTPKFLIAENGGLKYNYCCGQEVTMLHIKFEYKDELSHGKWNKQECTVSSLEECIKIYGLGIDCEYRILSVEEIK